MQPLSRPLLAAALLAVGSSIHAAEEPIAAAGNEPADLPRISGTVGAGVLATSGNTESRSANVEIAATIAYEVWRHTLNVTGYQASEEGDETAERYDTSAQSDYRFSERSYLFVHAGYQSDRFGAFDRRASISGGYGRRVLETATQSLDLEAGAGRRMSEPDGTNERNYEYIARLNGEFEWSFAANSSFTQKIEVQAGEDNTESRSVSAVRSHLVQNFALRLSHSVSRNSEVPAGSEKTDTLTAIALEYAF